MALTFVDAAPHRAGSVAATRPGGGGGRGEVEGPHAVLQRTLWLARIDSPAIAAVFDVVLQGSGGIVVAQWITGRSLTEVARTGPSPGAAVHAVRALVAGAETAHRADAALGLDYPDRIRISTSGTAVLAFPGVPAGASHQFDVQGLGAILYALISGHWPLPAPTHTPAATDDHIGGLPLAVRGPSGAVIAAHLLRPEVPFEIAEAIDRALQPDGGIRTAADVQSVLTRADLQNPDITLPAGTGGRPAAAAPSLEQHRTGTRSPHGAPRRRTRTLVLTLLAFTVVGILLLGYALTQLVSLFGGGASARLPSLSQPSTTAQAGTAPAPGPTLRARPVTVSGVTVFSPQGYPDNSATATRVIDGDPATTWSTDRYRNQFPAFKQGVGLLLTVGNSAPLASVGIDSPSAGTVVEIRSAPTPAPTLSETTVLSTATLNAGHTMITLPANPPVQYLMVWITRLATSPGTYTSAISEITLQQAG